MKLERDARVSPIGTTSAVLAGPLRGLAMATVQMGDIDQARRYLVRAVGVSSNATDFHVRDEGASTRFDLARLLVDEDPGAAMALASNPPAHDAGPRKRHGASVRAVGL